MATRLSDAELAARVRESSKVRSKRRRERLSRAGRSQMLVWIPTPLKMNLEQAAEQRGETLSVYCTGLLSAALGIERPTTTETVESFSSKSGQPDDDDEDAYWAAEATAVLDRIERGEERVITLEQWEARHGLGG